jgi:hypothetical protein
MNAIRFLILVPALITLTACEATKENLGLTRRAPDEFAVMTRAPLQMPPPDETATLPQPQPGMSRPQEVSPVQSAQTAVLGQPAATAEGLSAAENDLLQKAGAAQTNPNIRSIVNKEAVEETKNNRPVVRRILNIGKKGDDPATIVDAPAEMQRLKTNKQAGQAVTQGETPTLDD